MQLELEIRKRLVYSAAGFVLHAGVAEALARCSAALHHALFQICCVQGEARSGKTHFASTLAERALERGQMLEVFNGSADWDRLSGLDPQPGVILVWDDAHEYLSALAPGDSGPLVSLIEKIRVVGGKIVLFSLRNFSSFQIDQHLKSRIAPGLGYDIGAPADSEVEAIFQALAKQRGLAIPPRKIGYLAKRLPRDIAAIERYIERFDDLSLQVGKGLNFSLLEDLVEEPRS